MSAEHHDLGKYPQGRSTGLAAMLGLFFGGVAFFYAMPLRKALFWAVVTYGIVIASFGVLLVPVFFGCALGAAYAIRVADGAYGTAGSANAPEAYEKGHVDMSPVPPGLYQTVTDVLKKS